MAGPPGWSCSSKPWNISVVGPHCVWGWKRRRAKRPAPSQGRNRCFASPVRSGQRRQRHDALDEQAPSGIGHYRQHRTDPRRLMADIPGINEPMLQVLLAQTQGKPQWSRVESAQQLLIHAYMLSSTQPSALSSIADHDRLHQLVGDEAVRPPIPATRPVPLPGGRWD
jgi:hypothetical protein